MDFTEDVNMETGQLDNVPIPPTMLAPAQQYEPFSNVQIADPRHNSKTVFPYIECWKDIYDSNPNGSILGLGNTRHWDVSYTPYRQAPNPTERFSTSMVINGRKFPRKAAAQKKVARKEAAHVALKLIYLKSRAIVQELDQEQQIELAKTMGLTDEDMNITQYDPEKEQIEFQAERAKAVAEAREANPDGEVEGEDGGAAKKRKTMSLWATNKSPIMVLMEYGQRLGQPVKWESTVGNVGDMKKPLFEMSVLLGERVFETAAAFNKKNAKHDAALVAIKQLRTENAQGLETQLDLDEFTPKTKEVLEAEELEVRKHHNVDMKRVESDPTGSFPSKNYKETDLTEESFDLIIKHPISALVQFAQMKQKKVDFDIVSQIGPAHNCIFEIAVTYDGRQFPSVKNRKKRQARMLAADMALREMIKEGIYSNEPPAEQTTEITEEMTHFDKMAALSHKQFMELVTSTDVEIPGRKVIAAIIMKQGTDDVGTVISIGAGNRCISGDNITMEGTAVNDSHAEIVCRRGFLRYLYGHLLNYTPGTASPLLEAAPSGRLRAKKGITFHLYVSTCPCGDGALFSPRDASKSPPDPERDLQRAHTPTWDNEANGKIRTKIEGGEGTIPIDDDFVAQTWDGLQRGERLRTMSCSDKVCLWNVVGVQGSLLSHFLEPIYLDSLTLGYLFDHGHLSRAVCCRLTKGDALKLPKAYHLNHPWIGRVTKCIPPRDTHKTRAVSFNWSYGDESLEVTDGVIGMIKSREEPPAAPSSSRICKKDTFRLFVKVCERFSREKLHKNQSYRAVKQASKDYQAAKNALKKKIIEQKLGKWVSKPQEMEMFKL